MDISTTSRTRDEKGQVRLRLAAIGTVIALGLTGVILASQSAQAAPVNDPFAIDGVVPGASPPTPLTDTYGNVKELGPKNSNTTKIGVINRVLTGSVLGLSNPNAQVDFRQAWVKSAKGTETTPHDWLYFAWERDANSGSGFIAYEFMQNQAPVACAYDTATAAELTANCNPWLNRAAGDFMILWDQQGGSLNLSLRTWSGTAPNLTLGAPVALDSTVSEAKYSADGFRGEAALDLTATVFANATGCTTYANTIPSTVTGNSDTADYKDTILLDAPSISNCGGVTITKTDDDSPASVLEGATFTLWTDTHPADTATGHIAEDVEHADLTCITGADGTCTIAGVGIGDYWAVESGTPSGHSTAADQKVNVSAGGSASLTFVDPREFTVITIVCKDADQSLYASSVTFDGDTQTSLGAAPTGSTATELCGLGGARFTPKHYGGPYTGSVTIGQ